MSKSFLYPGGMVFPTQYATSIEPPHWIACSEKDCPACDAELELVVLRTDEVERRLTEREEE